MLNAYMKNEGFIFKKSLRLKKVKRIKKIMGFIQISKSLFSKVFLSVGVSMSSL